MLTPCASCMCLTTSRFSSGLRPFFDRVLERLMHEREIGIHPLQACILLLEVLDAFELADAQAAVFRLPVVERRVADPRLTAEVAHLLTRLMPAKKGNDLGLAESGSLHDSKVRIDLYFRMGEDQGSLHTMNRTGVGAGFSADDHPVDAVQFESGKRTDQRLKRQELDGGRSCAQLVNAHEHWCPVIS